jgi:hypothetical protein
MNFMAETNKKTDHVGPSVHVVRIYQRLRICADGLPAPRKRRRMSAAGRKRIAAAQRERWAALHAEQKAAAAKRTVKKKAPARKAVGG